MQGRADGTQRRLSVEGSPVICLHRIGLRPWLPPWAPRFGALVIDMQRHNFQFTGQRFHRIENGRLAGQLRDVAYQATTTDFWNSIDTVS